MLARPADICTQALIALQNKFGGIIQDDKLYPLAPVLSHLEPLEPASDLNRQWHVVQCEPSQEARVADGLVRECKFDCYYPTESRKIRVNPLRHRNVERPMMPGYVFAGFDPSEHWYQISELRGVIRLLKIGEQPAPVADRVIEHIRGLEIKRRGNTLKRKPMILLKPGTCVRLKEPLAYAGLLGFVTEVNQEQGKISVELELFGRRVPHWLQPEQVEAV